MPGRGHCCSGRSCWPVGDTIRGPAQRLGCLFIRRVTSEGVSYSLAEQRRRHKRQSEFAAALGLERLTLTQ
jgi:hypothetical protein